MKIRSLTLLILVIAYVPCFAGNKVTINQDKVLEINGKRVFPIGFTMAPPPGSKAPNGNDGLKELHDAGGSFLRTGPNGHGRWNEKGFEAEQKWMDAAADAGMYCLPWLKELSTVEPGDQKEEAALKRVVERFKDHPAMGCWKGADEPEWGFELVEPMQHARDLVRELDPDHPMWIVEAPLGTIDSMREYNDTMDITGQDVYPISYPPGVHSKLPSRELSLIGDHTRIMQEVVREEQPIWMTLQIAWSGVVKEGRTLRMPTFPQERFMAYEAIINGARGLVYFGGNLPQAMNEQDKKLGWNWTWFDQNLRPLLAEIGHQSPLLPALVARQSEIPIRCQREGIPYATEKDMEWCVREVDNDIFLLACNRGQTMLQVNFVSIPPVDATAEVMFESPRKVTVEDGKIKDYFAPFEVHVYRMHRKPIRE
jgi:hypothetical protein